MTVTLLCRHCCKTVPLNPRLKKKQEYCSAKECQQTRRSTRKAERYHNEPKYREKQLESQQRWRDKRPSDEYQKDYRESHPEYVDRNRELQRERYKKRQRVPSPKIVNGTSLSTQPSKYGVYAIIKVTREMREKIVNGTSFRAQLQILSGKDAILAPNGV